MSEFWSGLLTGIGTSGLVGGIVYWVQKRDGDRSESNIKNKVAGTTAIAREALRTTLAVQDTANRIHRAVRDAQSAAAMNPTEETLRPSHQAAAEDFLTCADMNGLRRLHTVLTGESLLYSGLIRDAEVLVSGETSPSLVPAKPHEVVELLQPWLDRVNGLMKAGNVDRRTGLATISEIHIELMRIHPFFDGNGLLGRAIVSALSKRLIGSPCAIPRDDPEHFACLRAGLSGRIDPLIDYLGQRTAA